MQLPGTLVPLNGCWVSGVFLHPAVIITSQCWSRPPETRASGSDVVSPEPHVQPWKSRVISTKATFKEPCPVTSLDTSEKGRSIRRGQCPQSSGLGTDGQETIAQHGFITKAVMKRPRLVQPQGGERTAVESDHLALTSRSQGSGQCLPSLRALISPGGTHTHKNGHSSGFL